MKTDKIQEHYESVYTSYKTEESEPFEAYERNRALKRIYGAGEGRRILDVGAGRGIISRFFLDLGYDVYAIEWTEAGVSKLRELGVTASRQDLEKLPLSYDDEFFDEVFWGDNIEHLFFPEAVAREIRRILKPTGRVVVTTPNHGWIINRLYYLFKGVPRRTEGHVSPIWEWQHIRYFNKKEIARFLEHCGFTHGFVFHGAERRQPFSFLSRYFPALFGSVMIVQARK